MVGNRKFRTAAALVFTSLLASRAYAQITVTDWNLNEEADAVVYQGDEDPGTHEEVDTANYFGIGIVFPYTQTDAVVTPSGFASAAGTYNFFVPPNLGTLGLAFDQYFGVGEDRIALNGGEIDFIATQNLDYRLDGSYRVSSGEDGPGTDVYLLVQLIDATDPNAPALLFSTTQETETAPGTDKTYQLGDAFGTQDNGNDLSGSLQATLISGHNYKFIYQYEISELPTEGSTAASTTTAHGELTFTVICNLPGITGIVSCIRGNESTDDPGVTLSLLRDGQLVKTGVTGEDGTYKFTDLDPGAYTITVTQPPNTQISGDLSKQVTVECGQDGTASFGVCPCLPSSITGRVTCNGNNQSLPIACATITAFGGKDAQMVVAVSDAEGLYTISGLSPGDYTVSVTPPEGMKVCLSPSMQVTLSCEQNGNADFCVCPCNGSLGGRVLCTQGSQSTPMPNVTVTAYLGTSTAGSAVTTSAGTYTITGLAPGAYSVKVTLPANTQSCGTTDADVTLGCDQDVTTDFCVCPFISHCDPASIAGMVFCSPNGQSTPEAGVTITAYVNNVVAGSAVTDTNGAYAIGGLAVGTYVAIVTPPANSQSCGSTSASVTLACGQTGAADFCVCPTCPAASIKGRITCTVGSGTTGVSNVTVTAYLNGLAAGSAVSASDGGYTIGGLAAGAYTVKMAMPSNGLSCGLTSTTVVLACGQIVTANFCECPATGTGCSRTPGYWKTHPSAWPVQSLMLGGVTYNATQLMNLLNTYTPSGQKGASDVSVKVAKFEISAIFSMLTGATASNIVPVVYNADAFLAAHPPGSNPKGTDATLGNTIQTQLDNYCNQFDCP